MSINKHIKEKSKAKGTKIFKTLDNKKLESVIGGPIASRGTETNVQDSN